MSLAKHQQPGTVPTSRTVVTDVLRDPVVAGIDLVATAVAGHALRLSLGAGCVGVIIEGGICAGANAENACQCGDLDNGELHL